MTTTSFANKEVICNKTRSALGLFLYHNKILRYLEVLALNVPTSCLETLLELKSLGRSNILPQSFLFLSTLVFYLQYQAITYNCDRDVKKHISYQS